MATDRLKQCLQLYRDDPPPILQFSVPLDRLMDAEHCIMLEQLLENAGGAWETRKAMPSLGDQLPDRSGLYMFVWRPPFGMLMAADLTSKTPLHWVLYVGRAGDARSNNTLKSRYNGEYAKLVAGDPEQLWSQPEPIERQARLRRYLSMWPLEYWFTTIDDKTRIAQLESKLIRLLAPPLNYQGGPKLRKGKAEKAF